MDMEVKNEYKIESFIRMFKEHAEEADKRRMEFKKTHKESFPFEPIPSHLCDDSFNLSTALSIMCAEIERLKSVVGLK